MLAQLFATANALAWPGVFAMIGTLAGNWVGDWIWERRAR